MTEARYVGTPDEVKIAPCYRCKHYYGREKCRAFEQIPDDILNAFHDHKTPYPGDNGIQFEAIDG